MNLVRHALLLACVLGAVAVASAAETPGPAPTDVIYPRNSEGAIGDTAANSTAFSPATGPSTSGVMTAIGYVVALGILAGAGWILLKRGRLPRPFSKNGGRLQVLETRLLGNRQFLVVVEYDDAKMLLGVCPGRIDYLTPLAGHPLAGNTAADDADDAVPEIAGVTFAARR